MKAGWFAFLIFAVLAFALVQPAEAGGYGYKHGHYGQSYSHGFKQGGYRKHGGDYYRGYGRGHNRGYYRSYDRPYNRPYNRGHRAYRHGYRKGYRHGYRSAYPAYRHGYSRGYRDHRPYFHKGGITLHFGY